MTNVVSGLDAVSIAIMTRVRSMSAEEVEAALVDARRKLSDKLVHAYYSV